MADNLTDAEFAELVGYAEELRRQRAGRLPHSLAFKFNDFVLGTANFTWPERGVYLGLLYRQFDKGSLPTDTAQLAAIVAQPREQFAELFTAKLQEKFRKVGERYYNKTMLEEWIAQCEYLLGKKNAGSAGGKASAAARKAKAEEPF
jgi:uncharacterized protein YdaU (DUF1376 family)